ncbi:MAG: hypothetical protein HY517_03590 [Candidatus Aenigmarchaeota archaeon]|nr:hypothetical protein [Candidatus Aenigmarchaeota archaeon]
MTYFHEKIEQIEKDLEMLKKIAKKNDSKRVSFRGMAKTKLSTQELDEEIKKSKKSLFRGEM